jgi:hypothetical protein
VASHGWFNRFKARANFHNVKVSGGAASADTKAAEMFPEVLRKIIEEGGYTTQQIFNVDETGFKGFEKNETLQEVADTIVKLAEQLKLEVDVADVEELSNPMELNYQMRI